MREEWSFRLAECRTRTNDSCADNWIRRGKAGGYREGRDVRQSWEQSEDYRWRESQYLGPRPQDALTCDDNPAESHRWNDHHQEAFGMISHIRLW